MSYSESYGRQHLGSDKDHTTYIVSTCVSEIFVFPVQLPIVQQRLYTSRILSCGISMDIEVGRGLCEMILAVSLDKSRNLSNSHRFSFIT